MRRDLKQHYHGAPCGTGWWCTTDPARVTCERCRRTTAWAAAHEEMPRTLLVWAAPDATVSSLRALSATPIGPYVEALAESAEEGLGFGRQATESGSALRWLMANPGAPIRWRLLGHLDDEIPF